MIYLTLVVLFLTLLYINIKKSHRYWLERSVKHRKPTFLFGHSLDVIFKRKSFFDTLIDLYHDFPNERYVGMYQMTKPSLIIKDPEIIKSIMVKDFDHFVDHRTVVPPGINPVWSKNLFALTGTEWKHMRTAVSPTFTSSKMRSIFSTVTDCVEIYMDYFLKKNGEVELELKDALSRYTNDVIATVAYGVRCDSINHRDNEFYIQGKRITTFGFKANMKVLAYAFAPRLSKFLGIQFFDQRAINFFSDIMTQAIKVREEKGIRKADMISLLLDERKQRETSDNNKNEKAELTDFDIEAQAFAFIIAGFDTVSSLLIFTAYELTVNPDVQSKLHEEIDEILQEFNGKLTYDALMKMKYMDMVISETLRLRTPVLAGDRTCTKPYTIHPSTPTEKKVELKIGDLVWVATNAIHTDPNYFPDPMKFDPERFSEENKGLIKPYTYMPFGIGPRICVGARLGQMEVKALMFNMLSKFDFVRNEKTPVPLKLSKATFDLRPEGDLLITLRPRNK